MDTPAAREPVNMFFKGEVYQIWLLVTIHISPEKLLTVADVSSLARLAVQVVVRTGTGVVV